MTQISSTSMPAAPAALPAIPEALWALMAEIGPRWGADTGGNVRRMIEAFSAVLAEAPKDAAEVEMDVVYGPHPRQRFDIFRPRPAYSGGPVGSGRPALLFVHGGAFVEGHRNRSNEIYANVLHCFARHGVLGINIGYRLADDSAYPAASQDVANVVAWTQANADKLGIDPARIFLMGHSAGGAHVASYAYDKRLHPAEGPGLAGLIVVSGRVRADALPENPNARKVEAYYGANTEQFEDVSPVSHIGPGSPPTFVAFAEFENPLIDLYCLELAHKLALLRRKAPPVMRLKRHNHTSIIGHFNTAETALADAILDFIRDPERA